MNHRLVIPVLFVLFAYCLTDTPPKGVTLPPGGIEWKNCTKPNEYYDCGSACQTECATLGKPCPIVNIRCNDDCYCIKGYARDCKGRCIPIKDCPGRSGK